MARCNFSTIEFYALESFYNATQGWNWNLNLNGTDAVRWNFTSGQHNPCIEEWIGIDCTYSNYNCYVSQLNFPSSNLVGFVTQNISKLTKLISLNLSYNSLRYEIPSDISYLKELTSLDLSNNALTGDIPMSIGNLNSLVNLVLYNNLLSSIIPSTLGQLISLVWLDLSLNMLYGAVPNSIHNLSSLTLLDLSWNILKSSLNDFDCTSFQNIVSLDLGFNYFSGKIPSNVAYMTNLQVFRVYANSLTGSLPSELFSITSIEYMEIYANNFSGPIPTEVGNLKSLYYLDASYNSIQGVLPTQIGELKSIQYIFLEYNLLHGALPNEIGELSLLISLHLMGNGLTGKIVPQIQNLTSINFLRLNNNEFSGPMPTQFYRLTMLVSLELQYNRLTGRLSSSIEYLTALTELILSHNKLSGPIPQQFSAMSQLSWIDFNTNRFSGTIPVITSNFTFLQYYDLSYNKFVGQINEEIGSLPVLNILLLQSNLLTGALPSSLGRLQNLQVLDISNNFLNGKLPVSIQQLSSLVRFNCSFNRFDGSIPFNSTLQTALTTIIINNNEFSSNLPSDLFLLPSLQVLIGSVNCFSGKLPLTICNANKLQSLIFDAMGGSPSCPNLPPKFFQTVNVINSVENGLLECILGLESIQTIHLAGNKITGSISKDVILSSNLTNLDLSHNKFHYPIPSQIYAHPWNSLSLSYNKFNGVLGPEIRIKSSLSLEVNQLSGKVPKSYLNVSTISILTGNLFECDSSTHSDLPTADTGWYIYACGSNNVDFSIYLFLGIIGTIIILYIASTFLKILRQFWGHYIQKYLIEFEQNSQSNEVFYSFHQIIIFSFAPYIIGLILAASLHSYFSTYYYLYAWSISFGCLTGLVPAIFIALYIIYINFSIYGAYHYYFGKSDNSTSHHRSEHVTKMHWLVMVVLFLVNAIVTVIVNSLFVQKIGDTRGEKIFYFQIALAVFKVSWSNIVINVLFTRTIQAINIWENSNSLELLKTDALYRTVLNIFSIMVAPCVATAIVSPDCFVNVFFASPVVTAIYSFTVCGLYIFVGEAEMRCAYNLEHVGYSSYEPPFYYTYCCSFTLMMTYTGVFVYYIIFSCFFDPLTRIMIRIAQYRLKKSKLGQILLILFPTITDPTKYLDTQVSRCFNTTVVATKTITILAVSLTFGVVFSPLGIICCVSLFAYSYFIKIEIGYVLGQFGDCNQRALWTAVDSNLKMFQGQLHSSTGILMCVCSVFLSFFLFDIFGSEAGGIRAAIPAVIMGVVCPAVVYCGCKYVEYRKVGTQSICTATQIRLRSEKSIDQAVDDHALAPNLHANANSVANPLWTGAISKQTLNSELRETFLPSGNDNL